MAFATHRNWQLYESAIAAREAEKYVALTSQQKFDRYVDFFDLLHSAKTKRSRDQTVEAESWEEKKLLRLKMVHMFLKLDEWKHGSIDSSNGP